MMTAVLQATLREGKGGKGFFDFMTMIISMGTTTMHDMSFILFISLV
jgi:hypothetical protein